MGVLSDNRSQIVNGGLISASFVSDLYDVFTGNAEENISKNEGHDENKTPSIHEMKVRSLLAKRNQTDFKKIEKNEQKKTEKENIVSLPPPKYLIKKKNFYFLNWTILLDQI